MCPYKDETALKRADKYGWDPAMNIYKGVMDLTREENEPGEATEFAKYLFEILTGAACCPWMNSHDCVLEEGCILSKVDAAWALGCMSETNEWVQKNKENLLKTLKGLFEKHRQCWDLPGHRRLAHAIFMLGGAVAFREALKEENDSSKVWYLNYTVAMVRRHSSDKEEKMLDLVDL